MGIPTILKRSAPLLLLAVSLSAAAHPQAGGAHSHGFWDGFIHPFTGLDHLLAMLAVGIWSVRQGGRNQLPLTFISMMLFGVLTGVAGLEIPELEKGVALTVALLGCLIAAAVRLPAMAGMVLVGVFAVLHGNAHAHELPQASSAFGLLAASSLLILAGRMAARLSPALAVKLCGAVIAATGVVLVATA